MEAAEKRTEAVSLGPPLHALRASTLITERNPDRYSWALHIRLKRNIGAAQGLDVTHVTSGLDFKKSALFHEFE